MLSLKLIITLLLLGGSAAGVYWGILPERASIKDINTQIQEVSAATDVAKNQRDAIEKSIASYEAIDSPIKDRVVSALPTNTDTPNIIATLDRIITDSGLAVSNIALQEAPEPTVKPGFVQQQPQDVVPVTALKEISFGITAAGDYSSMKHLVLSLENLLRLNDISTIAITHVQDESKDGAGSSSSSGTSKESDLLQISIEGKMYSLPKGAAQ